MCYIRLRYKAYIGEGWARLRFTIGSGPYSGTIQEGSPGVGSWNIPGELLIQEPNTISHILPYSTIAPTVAKRAHEGPLWEPKGAHLRTCMSYMRHKKQGIEERAGADKEDRHTHASPHADSSPPY